MLGLCGRREGGRDRCRAVLWVRAECELVVLDLLIGVCSKRMLTMLGGRKRGAQHHRFFFFFCLFGTSVVATRCDIHVPSLCPADDAIFTAIEILKEVGTTTRR